MDNGQGDSAGRQRGAIRLKLRNSMWHCGNIWHYGNVAIRLKLRINVWHCGRGTVLQENFIYHHHHHHQQQHQHHHHHFHHDDDANVDA